VSALEEPSEDRRSGLLRAAADELLERLGALSDLTRAAGSTTLGALPGPMQGAATDVLSSLRGLVMQVPPPTSAVELFLEEVKAKRALVQAMQVQLASFDSQLEVMERSLAPLHAWGRHWSAVQGGLAEALRSHDDRGDPPAGAE
jgi:hypothetical protein